MNDEDYMKGVLETESKDFKKIKCRFSNFNTVRLIHSAIGISTESGEFLDQLKKHLFYGKEINVNNLIEELGDLFWYIAVACDVLGVSFDELKQINHDKLRKIRYKNGFNEQDAVDRNLDLEQQLLERWY